MHRSLLASLLLLAVAPSAFAQVSVPADAGGVAILVRNPRANAGEPPYALLDQYGKVARYVEPSRGIDLASYVGSMVRVRHDTGETLLASQLEFNVSGDVQRAQHSETIDTPTATVETLEPIASDATPSDAPMTVDSAEPINLDELPLPSEAMHHCPECELRANSSVMFSGPCTSCGRMGTPMFAGMQPARKGGLVFDGDLLFLRLGSTVGTQTEGDSDYELAPRLSLAYMGQQDLGIRATYFEWDHSGTPAFSVDMRNIDLELVKRLDFDKSNTLVVGAGLRLNDFESIQSGDTADFDGYGGLLTGKFSTALGSNGRLYARAKLAILTGEGIDDEGRNNNMTRSQTELGFGYEHDIRLQRITITPHAGLEWQDWQGYGVDPAHSHHDNALSLTGFAVGLKAGF